MDHKLYHWLGIIFTDHVPQKFASQLDKAEKDQAITSLATTSKAGSAAGWMDLWQKNGRPMRTACVMC